MSSIESDPFPKGDSNDDLQQLSLRALRNALPVDRFLFRDERVDDKGVDLALELRRADGSFLNIRSQVQLKGTEQGALNTNGSYSHPIKTANLNYLLNGACPLYVLWIASRDELRFVWARDEARRLFRTTPEWMSQGSVTLRFTDILSAATVQGVYDRILQEGKLHRETHDILTRATLAEPVVVGINPQSLTVTDPDAIQGLLLDSGLSLVAGGYAAQVLGVLPLVKPTQAAEPRILLVSAYANMVIGNYMSAAGFLAKCMLSQGELSASDQHFLRTLRNACDYHTGRLDLAEFMANEREIAKSASPEVAVQHELETLRLEHLNTRDVKRRAVICEKLRATTEKIAESESHSRSFRLHARLSQLYADALEADAKYIHGLIRLAMQGAMGLPIPKAKVEEDLRQIRGLIEPLLHEANLLIEEAREQQHPLLFAEALVTQAIVVIGRTASSQFFLVSGKQKPAPMPAAAIQSVRQRLDDAAKMFAQAGSLEGEIRAKLTLADWLEIAGDISGAKDIARSVHGPAVAMGYVKQISRAEDHLSGTTEYQKTMAFLTTPRDMDAILAQATDEELKRFAEDSLKALNLPEDRLSVMERETWSMRDIAREQMHWCRHLGLMQDLQHTQSPKTCYLRDPSRLCVCTKFNYKSRIESTDWKTLIIAFKRAYCEGCSAREPKATIPPTA